MTAVCHITEPAACGRSGAKAKNAALPEPVTKAASAMMRNIVRSMATPPTPSSEAAFSMSIVMPPVALRPAAKTSAHTIRMTVEPNTLPMPVNMERVLSTA